MKRLLLIGLLSLSACLSVETKKTLDERRAEVEDAKIRLANITTVDSPDYAEAKAAVQTAEARLQVAKAEAAQERAASTQTYIDIGTSVIGGTLTALWPGTAPAVGALTALIALFRRKQ